jgi:stage II sporulation protein D
MRVRALFPLALVVLLAAAPALPARSETSRRDLGTVAAPVRLVPNSGDPIAISGLNRYFGAVELSSASDGLVVVNRLPMERYLLGLNEVPSHWPMESLKAQAVAARTYALHNLRRGRAGAAATYGFDICATVACQVYSGADVLDSAFGARWADAVAATEGETVLHGGEPILARYHSTSGGRTFANSQIFRTEPDYPYLRPVSSTTEGASPLYRWRTSFRIRHLQRMLARAGWWDRGELGRLRSARTVPSRAGFHYPDVVLRGTRGALRRSAEELRVVLRETAPAVFPDRYPGAAPTSSGRLPEERGHLVVVYAKRSAEIAG